MENVKNIWEELAILFNPETSTQDFATHFQIAKSIFEQQTDRSRIQNKTDDSAVCPQQLVMEFEEEKQKNWKEIKELCSAIWKRDNRPNAKRLRKFSDDCALQIVNRQPEIVPLARAGKNLYSQERIFRGWQGQEPVQLAVFELWESGKGTLAEIEKFSKKGSRDYNMVIKAIILKAFNDKDRQQKNVADFINELFKAWKNEIRGNTRQREC